MNDILTISKKRCEKMLKGLDSSICGTFIMKLNKFQNNVIYSSNKKKNVLKVSEK